MKRILMAASGLALIAAGPVAAASEAYAVTDLNLRAGPGPEFTIVDVIPNDEMAMVDGCLEEGGWCKVSYNGTEGWAYSEYLAGTLDAEVPVTSPQSVTTVETVTYEQPNDEGAAVGAVAGAWAASAAIGGPLAIVGGFLLGSGIGASINPDETTVTYIRENPVEPVYADGEVVVGAKITGEPTLYEIPDSEYSYIAVNDATAIVDPATGEILYIVR
ncbi:DUF1236 domain-containing protein [Tropicibacter sp. S64]|uniref:DUF1236 domain-containing protein n=1 Tax=Tropicibacter sp. S64 TaxID=3415122 RepID=UPI003C7B26E3